MKISCPACSAKYSIADDKVQERLAKIRCRKCGATIVIDGKTSPPNVYTAAGDSAEVSAPPAAPASADGGTEYSIDFGEGDQRNLPLREIVSAYKSGQITTETYVWADGFTDWKPLSEVPELMSAVSGGATATPAPWDARPTAQRSSQLPRTTQAARTGTNRPSGDLFGGVSRAGNEDDVATSAPEQPSGGGSGTGARNESSVLFSLSALTSAAQNQRPSARPPAASSSKDDSGLIDLKALTAAAVKSDTGAMAMPAVPAVAPLASPLGVPAPLGGFGSPLGGAVASGADLEPKKNKTPIIIAALLCVGMLAVAAAIALKPAPPPPPAPVVIAAPPAPTPAPTPEPIAAAPPATGTAEASAAPEASAKPAPVARTGGGRSAPRTSGKSTSTSSGSSTKKDEPKAAPAAPKSSNCGCGPADLQCAMRCAAKKK